MEIPIKMPQLGESVTEGTVGGWLKQVGEAVEKYEPLLEVISDKVDTEVTAPEAGILLSIEIAEGETVPVETVLAYIGTKDEEAGSSEPAAPEVSVPVVAPVVSPPSAPKESSTEDEEVPRLTPVVARMVSEYNIDLSQVSGTGRDGRVTKRDIEAYLAQQEAKSAPTPPPLPVAPVTPPAPVAVLTVKPPATAPVAAPVAIASSNEAPAAPVMPPRQRLSSPMVNVKHSGAHVTTVFEADLSAVTRHLTANSVTYQNRGTNLTYLAYFVEVLTAALRQHPDVNVSLTDDSVQSNQAINIAVMQATQAGVLAPVVKQADEKNLLGLAKELDQLISRANRNALMPTDIIGSTFTLNYNEQSQSLWSTATISSSQSASLGIGKVQKRVIVTADDTIALRPMAYLSFTFNHHVIDEGMADAFMGDMIKRLESY